MTSTKPNDGKVPILKLVKPEPKDNKEPPKSNLGKFLTAWADAIDADVAKIMNP